MAEVNAITNVKPTKLTNETPKEVSEKEKNIETSIFNQPNDDSNKLTQILKDDNKKTGLDLYKKMVPEKTPEEIEIAKVKEKVKNEGINGFFLNKETFTNKLD